MDSTLAAIATVCLVLLAFVGCLVIIGIAARTAGYGWRRGQMHAERYQGRVPRQMIPPRPVDTRPVWTDREAGHRD